MIDGLKVWNKWGPISGSPLVNVSRVHWHVQGIRDELPIKVGMSTYSCSSVDKKANIWHHFDFSGKSATGHSHFRLL